MRIVAAALAALAAFAATISAPLAQPYPSRPVTMIVPFPAGGATDTLGRFLGEQMREFLGQPVVIENVGGAAGRLAVGKFVRSAPDGYTISIGTSTTHMLTGGLYKLPYDLLTDLEPIVLIGSEPLLIAGKKDLPAKDLKGLIAWLKANPDKASSGVPGIGGTGHVAGLSFQKQTGTRYQFVPYRGNALVLQDLLGGQIDFVIEPSSNFIQQVESKTIQAYAVTAPVRASSLPNVPTTDEAGLKGFHPSLWYGLWVPKGTPKDVIAKLSDVMQKVLALPAVQERFKKLGITMTPKPQQTPQALRAFLKAETERWWPVIKAANIKLE